MTQVAIAQAITRGMTMGDIVEAHPEVIETLLDLGVQCVGCHVSPNESLEDGFRGHGMSEEEIQSALDALNSVIAQNGQTQATQEIQNAQITLTSTAAAKIKEFLAKEQKKALRIGVVPGGCSGNKYSLELDNEASGEDIVVQYQGIQLFMNKSSAGKLNGVSIDYVDSLQGSGFKINNPNATHGCGCGDSFR